MCWAAAAAASTWVFVVVIVLVLSLGHGHEMDICHSQNHWKSASIADHCTQLCSGGEQIDHFSNTLELKLRLINCR